MLGSSISAASVKEGEDIYLECGVQVGSSDHDHYVDEAYVGNDLTYRLVQWPLKSISSTRYLWNNRQHQYHLQIPIIKIQIIKHPKIPIIVDMKSKTETSFLHLSCLPGAHLLLIHHHHRCQWQSHHPHISQGEQVDVQRPGRTLVSRGILVLQNITRRDAGLHHHCPWSYFLLF